jgi:hypothetical protein
MKEQLTNLNMKMDGQLSQRADRAVCQRCTMRVN